MKNLIFKRLIAILLITVIIMAQYVITGITAITYAVDMISTSDENVQFRTYFKNGQEEVKEINADIDKKDLKMYVNIEVKNEGYFKGEISFENAGFKLKKEIKDKNIEKIENHIIYLKQINAGKSINIELEIEFIEDEEFNSSILNDVTKINLNGTYTSWRGNKSIKGTNEVRIKWCVPQDAQIVLNAKVLTNDTLVDNNVSKKVLQVLIESKLKDNCYPIKNTNIEMNIPEGAETVKVSKRTTNGTNGDKEFNDKNYKYENNKISINIENNDKINWKKDTSDLFVITCEYPENKELNNNQISIQNKITTYDTDKGTIQGKQKNYNIKENLNNIVTITQKEKEKEIYKGKLYLEEEREYTEYQDINIDYAKAIDKIFIGEEETKFINQEKEIDSDIEYKTIRFNKTNLQNIFGKDFSIDISSQSQNIETITNSSKEENGSISLQLPEETKEFTIQTSKPQNDGILKIEVIKNINQSWNDINELKEITSIQNTTSIGYTYNTELANTIRKTTIELKETEPKVELDTELNYLTTMATNNNFKFIVTLKAENEKDSLYKNPIINIVLPKEVKKAKIKECNISEQEDFKISEQYVQTKNGNQILTIELTGEQTKYEQNKEIKLEVFANIEVDELTPSKLSKIELNCTNDNIKSTNITSKEIEIQSVYGLAMYSKLSNYNSSNKDAVIKDENTIVANIDANSTKKEAKLNVNLINNYADEINNITIIGKVQSNNEFIPILKNINSSNAKIYYSTKEDASESDWTENITDAKAYKIVIDSIKPQQVISFNGIIIIPEKVQNNQSAQISNTINFERKGIIQSRTQGFILEPFETTISKKEENTEKVSTEQGIETKIIAKCGSKELKDGENIYEGTSIKYQITVKNTTKSDIKNLKIKAEQTNGKVWNLEDTALYEYDATEVTEKFYKPINNNTIDIITIDNLKAGENKTYEYDAQIDLLSGNETKNTFGTITITTENGQSTTIQTVKNEIKKAELKLETLEADSRDNVWNDGEASVYTIKVSNISGKQLNNINLNIISSKILSYDMFTSSEDYLEFAGYSNRIKFENLQKNDKNESMVSLKISNIQPNETFEFLVKPNITNFDYSKDKNLIDIFSYAKTQDGNIYYSNYSTREVYDNSTNIKTSQKAYINGKEIDKNRIVKNDEEIEFITTITNKSKQKVSLDISDSLPSGTTIKKVVVEQNNKEIDESKNIKENIYFTSKELEVGEKLLLKVNATIDTNILYSKIVKNTVTIKNGTNSDEYISECKITTEKETDEEDEEIDQEEPEKETEILEENDTSDKKFDLKIEKYVSSIKIKNNEGEDKVTFNDEKSASYKMKSSSLNGSLAEIEYTIKITNTGSLAGYVRDIINDSPQDIQYNESTNSNWYKENGEIHNESLAYQKLEPGETKELKLIATKQMTDSNKGLIYDTAKINVAQGENGTNDTNIEDNESSTNVVITIKTGIVIKILTIVIILISLLFIIIRKKKNIFHR